MSAVQSFHVKWHYACSTSWVHLREKYHRCQFISRLSKPTSFSCHKPLILWFTTTLTTM